MQFSEGFLSSFACLLWILHFIICVVPYSDVAKFTGQILLYKRDSELGVSSLTERTLFLAGFVEFSRAEELR
jgi:hypothetical protein